MTATADVRLRRGTAAPDVVWRLTMGGRPLTGPGPFMLMVSVRDLGMVLRKSTADGGLTWEAADGRLRWRRTREESLKIPEGRIARYVLEMGADAAARPIVSGYVIGEAMM